MAEYIEREAALKIIDNYSKTVEANGKQVVKAVRDIVNFICPTADVQEVRHGKNITKIKPVDEFECSECGFICEICENIYYDDCICHREYNPEFCPNCGAKMDKE